MTFDKSQTVREIAINNPATVRIFENFGIDYCCGGKRPLREACQSANAPIDKVLRALDELEASNIAAEERPWAQYSLADLTAHIIGRHHRYVREEASSVTSIIMCWEESKR
jgi:regulator of cell morphogenesis and NO signaling